MAKFSDKCWDASDWVCAIAEYEPDEEEFTLEDLENLRKEDEEYSEALRNHWDYPLSETDMLATDEDKTDQKYVLVKFYDPQGGEFGYGGYEYRWCEI